MKTFLRLKDSYNGPEGPSFIRYSIWQFNTKKEALKILEQIKKSYSPGMKILEVTIEKGNVFKKYKSQ